MLPYITTVDALFITRGYHSEQVTYLRFAISQCRHGWCALFDCNNLSVCRAWATGSGKFGSPTHSVTLTTQSLTHSVTLTTQSLTHSVTLTTQSLTHSVTLPLSHSLYLSSIRMYCLFSFHYFHSNKDINDWWLNPIMVKHMSSTIVVFIVLMLSDNLFSISRHLDYRHNPSCVTKNTVHFICVVYRSLIFHCQYFLLVSNGCHVNMWNLITCFFHDHLFLSNLADIHRTFQQIVGGLSGLKINTKWMKYDW